MWRVDLNTVCKFPHLTSGYIGRQLDLPLEVTLNSQILRDIWTQIWSGNQVDLFPQRIPRLGFFSELMERETLNIAKSIFFHQAQVQNLLIQSLKGSDFEAALGIAQYGIRIGLAKSLLTPLEEYSNPNTHEGLRLSFLRELCLSQISLDEFKEPESIGLIQLFHIARKRPFLTLAANIASRLLVQTTRYGAATPLRNERIEAGAFLREFLTDKHPTDFKKAIWCSVLWRGYAMADDLSAREIREMVNRAFQWTAIYSPQTPTQIAIQKEIQLTTCQTLARIALAEANSHEAESYFKLMTELDPLDSTAFSELGILFLKHERWNEAETNFAKAIALGPPGMAMNAYFIGKACRESKNFMAATRHFKLASAWDLTALSPRLDLFQMAIENNNNNLAFQQAKEILDNPDLVDQLEPSELQELNKLCGA